MLTKKCRKVSNAYQNEGKPGKYFLQYLGNRIDIIPSWVYNVGYNAIVRDIMPFLGNQLTM